LQKGNGKTEEKSGQDGREEEWEGEGITTSHLADCGEN